MAWSWSSLNTELSTILDDADVVTFGVSLRLAGTNAALRTLFHDAPVQSTATISSVSSYAFPSDLYRIKVLQVQDADTGYFFLEEVPMEAGRSWPFDGTVDTTTLPDGYWIWNKTIYFGRLHTTIKLYYDAYYTAVTASTTDIPVPEWAREAFIYWIASYCLNPTLVTRARLSMWSDKQDANPLDNPLIQAADYYRREYQRIMAIHHGSHQ